MLKRIIFIGNLLLVGTYVFLCTQNPNLLSFYKDIGLALYTTLFLLIPISSGFFAIIGALFSSSCEPFRKRYLDSIFIVSLIFYVITMSTSLLW